VYTQVQNQDCVLGFQVQNPDQTLPVLDELDVALVDDVVAADEVPAVNASSAAAQLTRSRSRCAVWRRRVESMGAMLPARGRLVCACRHTTAESAGGADGGLL
jgi:hypothetical protein